VTESGSFAKEVCLTFFEVGKGIHRAEGEFSDADVTATRLKRVKGGTRRLQNRQGEKRKLARNHSVERIGEDNGP